MNEALKRLLSDERVAVKLAEHVLNKEPDSGMAALARQFLWQREVLRSVVHAAGGSVFVPSRSIQAASDISLDLLVGRNDRDHGYDVELRPTSAPSAGKSDNPSDAQPAGPKDPASNF